MAEELRILFSSMIFETESDKLVEEATTSKEETTTNKRTDGNE